MPEISSIITFAIASVTLLLIPGPAVIYVLNRSVSDGRNVGLAAVAGLELGNFMHVLAASVGLSAVLATSATAFTTIKWLGAGYLVFVGLRTLVSKPQKLGSQNITNTASVTLKRCFTEGVVVNTLNPKVALFFLSYLPQFIDSTQGAAWSQALILGSTFVLIGCLTDGMYALTASALRAVLLSGRTLPFVQRYVAGTVFIILGIVAVSTAPTAAK